MKKWGVALHILFGTVLGGLSPAFAIDLFQNNEAALLAREQALASAKPSDEISVLTFTFRDGRSARSIVRLLGDTARARRSIVGAAPVRILVDGHFTTLKRFPAEAGLLAWAESQGVQVRAFNPINGVNILNAPWINHRKLFLVGDTLIFGGRNLAPHYLESTKNDPGFADVDLRINAGENPDLAFEFETLGGPSNETWKGLSLKRKMKRLFDEMWDAAPSRPLEDGAAALAKKYTPPVVKVPKAPAESLAMPATQGWEILRSEWDPQFDDFRRTLLIAIEQEPAGGEIYFESPYFFPDDEILRELQRALERGVRFTLVTNTFKTANGGSKAISLFMDRYYRDFLKRGATLRFTVRRMLHGKLFVFGKTGLTYMGSHNAHRRSGKYDLETMIAWREKAPASLIATRRAFWEQGEGKGELGEYRSVADDVIDVLAALGKQDAEEKSSILKIIEKAIGGVFAQADVSPEKRAAFRARLEKIIAALTWVFEEPVGEFL